MHKVTITWPMGLSGMNIEILDAAADQLEAGSSAKKVRYFNEDGILSIDRFFATREIADQFVALLAQYEPGSVAITEVE